MGACSTGGVRQLVIRRQGWWAFAAIAGVPVEDSRGLSDRNPDLLDLTRYGLGSTERAIRQLGVL